MRDGIKLRGVMVHAAEQPARGAMIVLVGNMTNADGFVKHVQPLRDSGVDLFLYDYRGYGRSEGTARFAALVDDTIELLAALRARGYRITLVYGASLGSFIGLKAGQNSALADGVFTDSILSRVSTLFGCPEDYDPVQIVESVCKKTWILVGKRDKEFDFDDSAEVRKKAESCGAKVFVKDELGHPFQDGGIALSNTRRGIIRQWIQESVKGAKP